MHFRTNSNSLRKPGPDFKYPVFKIMADELVEVTVRIVTECDILLWLFAKDDYLQ